MLTGTTHEKLLIGTCLYKGNVLRIVSSDDHITNIKKKTSTTGWSMNKQGGIMSTKRETSSSDSRGKSLKPTTRIFVWCHKENNEDNKPLPLGTRYLGGGRLYTSSWSLPLRKAFFTSSWEMDPTQIEATIKRVRTVVMWATWAKVSSWHCWCFINRTSKLIRLPRYCRKTMVASKRHNDLY